MVIPAIAMGIKLGSSRLPSVTVAIKAMTTSPMPAFSQAHKLAQHRAQRAKVRDPWLIVTVLTTCTASIIACWYFFQQHQILLYVDGYSHLRLARGLFDNATPGLTQLGGVWLPLQHVLMAPLAANDYLFIAQTIFNIMSTLTRWMHNFEVIVVNDGSKDRTGAIVARLAAYDRRIRLINHPVNKGYGAALVTGFQFMTKSLPSSWTQMGSLTSVIWPAFSPLLRSMVPC